VISFFAKHPTAANLLMIVMAAAGLLSVGGLRRETFPDAAPTEVEIGMIYPGATPEDVDEAIIERLEEELEGVQYLKEMRSTAQSNRGTVVLEMLEGGRYEAFRNEIENAVTAIDDFPDDAEPPIINRLNTRDPVLDVLVEADLSAKELYAYARDLRDRLLASGGVSEVQLGGFSDNVFRVNVSPEALQRFGISPTEVAEVIRRQNLDLPAGKVEAEKHTLVRVQEERRSAAELSELVVRATPDGGTIRLGDVAEIVDEFDLSEDQVTAGGRRAVILQIRKSKNDDTLKVAETVKDLLRSERAERPGISLTVMNDFSELVQDRISLLLKNGWQGCVLVFLTMWLFFNARLSFWVVASLPVSFLAAFAVAPLLGLTINMLTMVGLLMAIGLLMDDGIVIAENIARRRGEGEPAMTAAVNGVRQVGAGVFSSFLTTCSVLGPLMFISGDLGRVLRVLPMMLLLVLAMSLVEAFLILPSHLGHSLAHQTRTSKRGKLRRGIETHIDQGRDVVGAVVRKTIAWRYLTAGIVGMVFLLSIGLIVGGWVRGQVFPSLEGDTIVARVLMRPGTPLERTEQVIAELQRTLNATNAEFKPRQPGQQDLLQTTYVRYNQNTDAFETGPHVATLFAELLSNEVRDGRIDQIIEDWSGRMPVVHDAISISFDEPSIGPQGRAIEIELSGRPLDELDAVSEEIQSYLSTFEGVFNLSDDLRPGQDELLVRLRPSALGMGISAAELARQLRGSFEGLLIDQLQVGREGYDIEVRYGETDRDSLSDLEDYRVIVGDGAEVPLSDVAELVPDRGWSRISRLDRKRVVNVLGSVNSEKTNTLGLLARFQEEQMPGLLQRHPGLEIRFRGEAEKGSETGKSLLSAAVIGCLGVFVILSFQFRSYLEPLVVMIAIPFAFVGVVWGHFLFGLSLSLPSIMGYASLAGIVVNDSILLMLFLKSKRSVETTVAEAAEQASRIRFRAVTITSLTTIAGLMPLLLERSLQAQVLIPIAISICFGLLASTLLVLLVLPPLYVILDDFGLTESTAK
jgi:multidrug efflux pump subunit AcrB